MDTISVIIPVYNLDKYVKHCLDSVCRQTYQNLEIIIVDDGSADRTYEICREYAKTDSRVQVFTKENGGVSSARNFGLEKASGEYVGFVDGDDIVAPDYFERLMAAVDGNALAMCMHKRISSYDEGFSDLQEDFKQYRAAECAEKLLAGRFPVCVWGGILLKQIIGNLRFPEGIRNNEDKYFLYHYLLNAGDAGVAFTNRKMYGYLVRPGSATKSGWNGRRDTIIMADAMHELTMDRHPEWEELSTGNRLAVRLNTLRAIAEKRETYQQFQKDFEQIRKEALSLHLNKDASRSVRWEYQTLKIGNVPFFLLVRAYKCLMPEKLRFLRNIRVTMQN